MLTCEVKVNGNIVAGMQVQNVGFWEDAVYKYDCTIFGDKTAPRHVTVVHNHTEPWWVLVRKVCEELEEQDA